MMCKMLKLCQQWVVVLLLCSVAAVQAVAPGGAPLVVALNAPAAAPDATPAAAPVPDSLPAAPKIDPNSQATPGAAANPVAPATSVTLASPLSPANPAKPFRIALLLPTHSDSLAQAANALRKGVLAAWERDADGIEVQTIETDDNVAEIIKTYQIAASEFDCIIGPLARSAVSALAQSGPIPKPTLVLSQGDASNLPDNMLPIGLSIEDEARQLVQRAAASVPRGKVLVIHTNVAWQRRAASAFLGQWQGVDPGSIELLASSGYLSASSLGQLKAKIRSDKPNLIFLSLTALQTAQIRSLLPLDARIYGTSQLHADNNPQPLLDGIALLDLPWLVQPDHSAVMIYPHLENAETFDNERLYALGLDALRIAREIGVAHRTRFELDGVTGQLKIQFGKGPARFERQAVPAVYRAGLLQALP
jgi:outer membrane PBP1 activator LpoA protein